MLAAMLRILRKLVPRRVKVAIRRELERRERVRLFGALAPMVPPVELLFDGPGSLAEFKANGDEFLRIYRDVCGLRPDERMLDVGSGIGRKTLPLTQYFNSSASYDGIDVSDVGVDWCRKTITPRFGNFRFARIDVYNRLYNPTGTCPPSEYEFPFADESFTFAMLGSVFTHMLPKDVERYLSEVSRVLKPGGRCLITYFLLNGESRASIASGASALPFNDVDEPYATISNETPEAAIALDEELVATLYRRFGLEVVRIDYGSWCGRQRFLSYQDLILAVKRPVIGT